MHSESFLNATLTRFINGAVIKTRISKGYHICFINDSIEMANDDPVADNAMAICAGYWRYRANCFCRDRGIHW